MLSDRIETTDELCGLEIVWEKSQVFDEFKMLIAYAGRVSHHRLEKNLEFETAGWVEGFENHLPVSNTHHLKYLL